MMFCRCCCVVYGCVDQFMRRKYSNPIVLINRHMTKIEGGVWNRAKIWQDHCFIDQGDSNEWAGNNYSTYFVQWLFRLLLLPYACITVPTSYRYSYITAFFLFMTTGPVRWWRGSLQIIHGSPQFPPGRELLFFHRPHKVIDFPEKLAAEIFEDMMTYGYLLPNWVPLLTRYMCRKAGATQNDPMKTMQEYRPFDKDCFGKKGGHKHSLEWKWWHTPSNWLQSSDFGVAIIRDGIVVNVFFLLEEQAGRSRSDVVVSQFMV